MSENVGASTSQNPKGFHGLHREHFNLLIKINKRFGMEDVVIQWSIQRTIVLQVPWFELQFLRVA
jgi:hypothetical protein